MSDSLLDRYANWERRNLNGPDAQEGEDTHDLGAFGFLRGSRERATMLELRRRDGNILAIGYGWLDRVEFDPSEGITLHLAAQKIRIRGRNLNVEVHPKVRLFEAICRHRVPWIRESERADVFERDAKVVIDAIEC